MALSGSFGTNFSGNQYGGGYRLQVDWYATQNIANNTSTVRADLYLVSLGSSWTIDSSATKSVSLHINGAPSVGSGAGLASLGGNQKKFIFWHEVVVPHNSDGTKSLDIVGVFDIKVSLSNQWYETVRTSQTITLDTIPRASTITTVPDITAGRNHVFSINRFSSEFVHTVSFYLVDGGGTETHIKTLYDQGTGGTFEFNDAEVYTMYQKLNKGSSMKSRIKCTTLRYGVIIGSSQRDGTCYNYGGGVVTFNGFNFGDSLPINIVGHNSMKHTVKFYFEGTLIKTLNNLPSGGTTVSWQPSEVDAMLAKIPNKLSGGGEAVVTSYWINGGSSIQVWNDIASGYGASAGGKALAPSFTGGYTYKDINTITTAITLDDQYIIQNKSKVRVELLVANKATARTSATMVEYVATLNGKEIKQPWSSSATVTFDFNEINAGTNATLSVRAVDSRGLYTTLFKSVKVIPYAIPSLSADVKRKNNFEQETTITASGSISPLNINGSNKNTVMTLQYRSKTTVGGTWSNWTDFTYSTTMPNFTATNVVTNFDNLKGYSFEIKVTDKLGSMQINRVIGIGQPIFFIDSKLKTIGIGKFPTSASNGLEVVGKIESDGITSKLGLVQIGSLTRANHGNGCAEFSYNELTSELSLNGRNWDSNTTHDSAFKVNGKITGKEIWSYNNGGTFIDSWGNIKGQPTAGSGNTFSIKDADDRVKFLTPIGKGSTGSTDIHAHTGGIKLYHNNINCWNFWQSGGGAYAHFDMGAGRLKWNGDNATFEFLGINGGWAKVYGDWNVNSSRDVKKNIFSYDDSALALIASAPTYQYHYLTDDDEARKRLGLIVEESPKVVVSEDGKSIDTYAMMTLLWKAVQELSVKTDNLDRRITMR